MPALKHTYPFDPSYGYSPEDLLAVGAPDAPADFESFWMARYERAVEMDPALVLVAKGRVKQGWRVHDMVYQSTGGAKIGGWCLTPAKGTVERVMVVLHGYGGREEPDFYWSFENTALLFPCSRGLGRSPHPPVSANPLWHVLHDIQDRDRYVHGGCVEDVWLGVSAALGLFPQAAGRVGLIGTSFGGGIGALALAGDRRIARAHFNVPSFGNHPLRLALETTGSGASVRAMHRRYPKTVEYTLSYHDAAVAARWIGVPVHFACALFDPMVAPPGQFAIYNAVPGEKALFTLRAGHFEYPGQAAEERALLQEVHQFFAPL
ncbi:MAG: acetylxylan esterase [Verrucomicrobiota bacterium]